MFFGFRNIIYGLLFALQFFIAPLFLDPVDGSKYFLFFFLICVCCLFSEINSVSCLSTFIVLSACFFAFVSLGLLALKIIFLLIVLGFFLWSEFVRSQAILDVSALSKKIFRVISVTVVISSCLGIYEYSCSVLFGPTDGMLIPYLLPANPTVRIGGMYGQPNLFALLMLVGVLVMFYQYLYTDEVQIRSRWAVLFKYVPFACVATVFFLTRSRSGQLAFGFSYLFLFYRIYGPVRLSVPRQVKITFLSLSVVLCLSALFAYGLDGTFSHSALIKSIAGSATKSVNIEARFFLWTAALLMFLAHPWMGVGFSNFQISLPEYAVQAYDTLGFIQYEAMGYTRWAHSEFFQLLAEGGLFVVLPIVVILFLYLRQLLRFSRSEQVAPLNYFCHLLLLPFLVQGMFSWTFRFLPLAILFFTFLGLVLAHYPVKTFALGPRVRFGVRMCAMLGLVCTLMWGGWQWQAQQVCRQIVLDPADSVVSFERLVQNPFLEHPLLLKATPLYVKAIIKEELPDVGERILPYVEQLALMQGAHWQWYHLAVLSQFLGKEGLARSAIDEAIALRPAEDLYWGFLHYLNVLTAVEETGKSIDNFLPTDEDSLSHLENPVELFNGRR